MSKGRDVSEYFAHVVMNVTSQNLELRKLIYIYLLKYAEQKPDLALHFINTFQNDLNDSDPIIRAMALRVLIGINWFGDEFDEPQMALRVASLSNGEFDETQIVHASSYFFLGDEPDPTLIRKQLDSNSDDEKLDAMKKLIAVRFHIVFFSSTDTFISSCPKVAMSSNILPRLSSMSPPKISRYGNWCTSTF